MKKSGKMKKSIFQHIEQKIYNIVHNQLVKIMEPDIIIKEVKDIDLKFVKRLKSEYGIGGIILDVDDTIRKEMMEVPDCNEKWVEFMKREFKLTLLSNGYNGKIKEFANERGIPYICFAKKPLKKNFLYACNEMGLYPENVLVIGNDVICDIYGANKCGMITAIVDSVEEEKDFIR